VAGGDRERVAPRAVAPPGRVDLQFDESRLAQHAEVLGYGGGSKIELGGEV